MPWKEVTLMSQRHEFVSLAREASLPLSELARRFGISRKTAYKWLHRDQAGQSMADQSRRPAQSPTRTAPELEAAIVAWRQRHPCWGGRKLAQVLRNEGYDAVPAPSTITHILRRQGLLESATGGGSPRWTRFEHAAPNDLWQMDFKGSLTVGTRRCDPLTVLDDHSRYNVVLQAVPDMKSATVQATLTEAFRRYGLPRRMNMDNGSPWGSPGGDSRGLSALTIWLVRLGIHVSFSAPHHPQTNGKDERFHRSLKAEVIARQHFHTTAQLQQALDQWRTVYNHVRPHQALALAVPASRYQPSPRRFPETLPPIDYAPDDHVALVMTQGIVHLLGHTMKVSNALRGHPIAARPRHDQDGIYDLFFAHHRLATIDLREAD